MPIKRIIHASGFGENTMIVSHFMCDIIFVKQIWTNYCKFHSKVNSGQFDKKKYILTEMSQ